MFLRKLGKRGVAMTEYAILLAFIAGIGGSFASDNGLGQSIINAITGAKNAIEDAGGGQSTGKHALKSKGLTEAVTTALDYQTSIPYNFISERLGEGKQLAAIGFDNKGNVENVWYSEGGELKALDSSTVSEYNGKWENGSNSVQGEFWKKWNDSSAPAGGYKSYNADVNKAGMFVAYDKYGNVVQNVNTSGLSGSERSNVQDKTTNIYLKGNGSTIKYDFNDTDGFYVKPKENN